LGSNCSASGSLLAHFDESKNSGLEDFKLVLVQAQQIDGVGSITVGDQGTTWIGCGSGKSFIESIVIYGAKAAHNVTLGRDKIENVRFDEDLMRLQIGDIGMNWCDQNQLRLTWNYDI
jgi:hypothetical protein